MTAAQAAPPVAAAGSANPFAARLAATRRALLFGNFAIGCGVMVVAGSLNDLVRGLAVSVALGGQLIAVGALVMCLAAPLLAGWVSGFDRRRLLTASLLWFAIGHALSALMPSYASLLPVRALTVLGAAIFTPQAAAAVAFMAPPEQRGRAITFIFLGWSVASVLGMPMAAWIGATLGWRSAFAVVAVLALVGAVWVARVMPDGVKPAALSLAAWKTVFVHPVLMAMVAVTALVSAGQFALLSFLAPYSATVLHASPGQLSLLFAWFGGLGLIGTVALSRTIDQVGAGRAATIAITMSAATFLVWPLADSVWSCALLMLPWGLACFASNSAQQARLNEAAPPLAAALLALNSSAIYAGQAIGSSSGGWMIAHSGHYRSLSWFGLVFVLLALGTSLWVSARTRSARV